MAPLTISKQTARRFILGRQGLWPGRRWSGEQGLDAALRASEAIQMDPLNVVARSHDIALWGRVLGYQPAMLHRTAYERRQFFDYGGSLFLYPMNELPYWRTPMSYRRSAGRWADFASANQTLLDDTRATLASRGPLGNRDFTGGQRVQNYRGRKDSALALYYLWITGETMISHRLGFERVYDFTERVAPAEYLHEAPEDEAAEYFARKMVAFRGLVEERRWGAHLASGIQLSKLDRAVAQRWLVTLAEQQAIATIRIEESREPWVVLSDDLADLSTIEAGGAPEAWRPVGPTTEQEITLLAPLEIVSARSRANWLFDFEYLWEVYKPAATRRWGYYTLPILYGDRLVARLDPRFDRATNTLIINGYWEEPDAIADAAAYRAALAAGLARFGQFLGARRMTLDALSPVDAWAPLAQQVNVALDSGQALA